MARKGKIEKYSEIRKLGNIIEITPVSFDPVTIAETWRQSNFKNNNSIVLEIGCGKGDFILDMATENPNLNLIGLDIKGARLWHGAKAARATNLSNVIFLRMQACYLDYYFPASSIAEIWLTFPDPHTKNKKKNPRKRLTAPSYLAKYKHVLKDGGSVHFKTDNSQLYDFTLKSLQKEKGTVISCTANLYGSPVVNKATRAQTEYEHRVMRENVPIKYINFTF